MTDKVDQIIRKSAETKEKQVPVLKNKQGVKSRQVPKVDTTSEFAIGTRWSFVVSQWRYLMTP